jgi:VanZ family protein
MRYIPVIVVTIIIFVVVSIPGPKLPPSGFSGMDKLAHFLFFGTWSLSAQFSFTVKHRWRWILVVGIGFGITTEIIQLFVKDRSFEWLDVGFDALGLILAAWSGPILLPRAQKIWPLSRWVKRPE